MQHTLHSRRETLLDSTPSLQLPLHRPPPAVSSDPRPHTAHSCSAAMASLVAADSSLRSTMAMASSAASSTGRLPRDDTATDMSFPRSHQGMKSDIHLSNVTGWGDNGHQLEPPRDRLQQRRNTSSWKLPTSAPPSNYQSSTTSSSAHSSFANSSRPSLVSRRSSRSYKENLKDGLKDIRDRLRRSSTAQHPESSSSSSSCFARHNNPSPPGPSTTVPPTSPSKRNGRHGDDRPKKHVRNLLASSERKDTPAPPNPLNPFGPQRRTFTSGLLASMQGGDRARQSAASWKQTFPQFADVNWSGSDDLQQRRSRVGSMSSAADSGADLSTYGGSCKDSDGDVDMFFDHMHGQIVEEPRVFDFVQELPSEISLQVFEYLDARDLMQAERVSRDWHMMASETSVWRNAFLRKYQRRTYTDPPSVQVGGAGCGIPNKPNQEWKHMYKARVELEKNWRKGPTDAGKAVYLAGHTDSVYCLQFDEEKIITGSRDRTIRVWDINNFTCKMVIGGPNVRPQPGPKVLRTVDYPDFHIATASVNGTAYGDQIFKTPSQWHDASILCLQYDEKILVTGSSDCDLLVWDIKTYEPIRRLRKHSGGVLDVALDAKHIVSCSKDSRIIVWNRETYEAKGELTGHRGPVNAVQLRGKYLASASGDGIARLWDIESMKLIREFPQKERGLAAVEFSEDMKYVLAGGNDTITYKFEVETGREVSQFTGHSQLVRSLWLDGANDRVVTGSYDLDLRVYDFTTGAQLWRAQEWTTSWMLAAKSDYRRIVATSQDGRILIVDFGLHKGSDIRDGQPLDDVDLLRGLEHTSAIRWRDPWAHDRKLLSAPDGGASERRVRESSVAADGEPPAMSPFA